MQRPNFARMFPTIFKAANGRLAAVWGRYHNISSAQDDKDQGSFFGRAGAEWKTIAWNDGDMNGFPAGFFEMLVSSFGQTIQRKLLPLPLPLPLLLLLLLLLLLPLLTRKRHCRLRFWPGQAESSSTIRRRLDRHRNETKRNTVTVGARFVALWIATGKLYTQFVVNHMFAEFRHGRSLHMPSHFSGGMMMECGTWASFLQQHLLWCVTLGSLEGVSHLTS